MPPAIMNAVTKAGLKYDDTRKEWSDRGGRKKAQEFADLKSSKGTLEERVEEMMRRLDARDVEDAERDVKAKQVDEELKKGKADLRLETKKREEEGKMKDASIAQLKRDNVYLRSQKLRSQKVIKRVFDKRFYDRGEGFGPQMKDGNEAAHDLDVKETILVFQDLGLDLKYRYTNEFQTIFGCSFESASDLADANLSNWITVANAHAKIESDEYRPPRLGDNSFRVDAKNIAERLAKKSFREECTVTRSDPYEELKRLANRGTSLIS